MKAYLISYKEGTIDLAFPLVDSGTLIGRDAGCLVQLTDPRISKRHALIKHEANDWIIEDLGSKNGTTVNGEQLEKPCRIDDGYMVSFGPMEFEFTTQQPPNESFAPGHVIDLSTNAGLQTIQRK